MKWVLPCQQELQELRRSAAAGMAATLQQLEGAVDALRDSRATAQRRALHPRSQSLPCVLVW